MICACECSHNRQRKPILNAEISNALTPYIQEFSIGRGRDGELALLALAAQGSAHVLFSVIQGLERDLRGFAWGKRFHVRQNIGHDPAMLAVAALRPRGASCSLT